MIRILTYFGVSRFCLQVFFIPNGRIRLIKLPLGVLVLVSQFRLLGVDEFNICGSEHHAL